MEQLLPVVCFLIFNILFLFIRQIINELLQVIVVVEYLRQRKLSEMTGLLKSIQFTVKATQHGKIKNSNRIFHWGFYNHTTHPTNEPLILSTHPKIHNNIKFHLKFLFFCETFQKLLRLRLSMVRRNEMFLNTFLKGSSFLPPDFPVIFWRNEVFLCKGLGFLSWLTRHRILVTSGGGSNDIFGGW